MLVTHFMVPGQSGVAMHRFMHSLDPPTVSQIVGKGHKSSARHGIVQNPSVLPVNPMQFEE